MLVVYFGGWSGVEFCFVFGVVFCFFGVWFVLWNCDVCIGVLWCFKWSFCCFIECWEVGCLIFYGVCGFLFVWCWLICDVVLMVFVGWWRILLSRICCWVICLCFVIVIVISLRFFIGIVMVWWFGINGLSKVVFNCWLICSCLMSSRVVLRFCLMNCYVCWVVLI